MARSTKRRFLVTGAAGDLGQATARLLVEQGGIVLAADRDARALASIANGETIQAIPMDVTDEASVSVVASTLSSLDGVFAAAGIEGPSNPISDVDLGDFRRVLEVNVTGVFLTMKHFLPLLEETGGSFVAAASTAGLRGAAKLAPYVASKHAVIGLMRSAGAEWGGRGVRVNAIAPGAVEGRMMASIETGLGDGASEGVKNALQMATPDGRYATPREIATFVAFLLSNDARHINGAVHVIDGGKTAL